MSTHNVLQHTATCCNMLQQHTATCCNMLQLLWRNEAYSIWHQLAIWLLRPPLLLEFLRIMWDITCSYGDMTPSQKTWLIVPAYLVEHDSFMCWTPLIHICETWLIRTVAAAAWVPVYHLEHDSVICVTFLQSMGHDSFMCKTWLIHMRDMTDSYRRCSFSSAYGVATVSRID